jgi:hypothetical protein
MDVAIGLVLQMEAIEDTELFELSTHHFDSDSHRLVPRDLIGSANRSMCLRWRGGNTPVFFGAPR